MTESRQRSVALALSALVFAMPVVFVLLIPHPLEQPFGVDFTLYRDVTIRWLNGGSYFEPYQLAGAYPISAGDVLYPPVALWLFVPFALMPEPLAWLLWFALPVVAVVFAVGRLRPRPVSWPLLAFCLAWPTTLLKTWTGNPVIWCVAALALGVLWAWPSVFVVLKPSLGPFALFGVWRRSWWIAAAVVVVASLPFGAMWVDWATSVANSQGGGVLYSSLEVPMLLLPLVAWGFRTADGVALPGRISEIVAAKRNDVDIVGEP
jgi:glycosyl transferase family 87